MEKQPIMNQSDKGLPDTLTQILRSPRITDGEIVARFAGWLIGLSMFKQLNMSDQDIADTCRSKGWPGLGYDYESPPSLDEFMGRTSGERLGERFPISDRSEPDGVWKAWLCLGDQLAQELGSAPLAETMATLRRWPVVRSPVAPEPSTNVIPFRPRTQTGD